MLEFAATENQAILLDRLAESSRLTDRLQLDLRYAFRELRRDWRLAAAVVAMMSLAIGLLQIVSVTVYALLVRPLPYPRAGRVVQVVQWIGGTDGQPPTRTGLSIEQFRTIRQQTRRLEQVALYRTTAMNAAIGDDPVRITGAQVSTGFFEIFGVAALQGRVFAWSDEESGATRVVILGEDFWRRLGHPAVDQATTIQLASAQYRVVGVMPRSFRMPTLRQSVLIRTDDGRLDDAPQFWVPFQLPIASSGRPTGFSTGPVLGLLAPGVNSALGSGELNGIIPALPDGRRPLRVELSGVRDEIVRGIRPVLLMFQAAVIVMLLATCANTINMLLVRAWYCARNTAVRIALGASPAQIAREAVLQTTILTFAGGAAGCLVGIASVRVLRGLPIGTLPRVAEVSITGSTVAVTLLFSSMLGIAIGGIVSLRAVTLNPSRIVRDDGYSATNRSDGLSMLIGTQVAFATVLVVGCALLLSSLVHLVRRNAGFNDRYAVTYRVSLPPDTYSAAVRQAAFHAELVRALTANPRVVSATVATALPFQPTAIAFSELSIGGRTSPVDASISAVPSDYFRSMRIPLVHGREFAAADVSTSDLVVVVNEAFAQRYLGRTMQDIEFLGARRRVVGIAANTMRGLGAAPNDVLPEMYFPITQMPASLSLIVGTGAIRTDLPGRDVLAMVRQAAARIEPHAVIDNVVSMERLVSEATAEAKLYSIVSSVFATAAAALAALGIYGIAAHTVVARRRESGIRIALGARRVDVLRSVAGKICAFALCGLAAGLCASYWLMTGLQAALYGVRAADALAYGAASFVVLAMISIASYLPAARSAAIDPSVLLREQ